MTLKKPTVEPVYVGCAHPGGCPRTIRNLTWLIERRGWLSTPDGKLYCPAHRSELETDDQQWVTFTAKLRPYMTSALDEEASELGITRMALIRVILSNHLEGRS